MTPSLLTDVSRYAPFGPVIRPVIGLRRPLTKTNPQSLVHSRSQSSSSPLQLPFVYLQELAIMAIYPKTSAYAQSDPQPISIEAWTEQATQSLHAVSLATSSGVRGTSASLTIPLDEHRIGDQIANDDLPVNRPRREPLRRDSLKRREALLKGKEGSRRRQRWENGWSTFFHSTRMASRMR
jgi:hypothetical protein